MNTKPGMAETWRDLWLWVAIPAMRKALENILKWKPRGGGSDNHQHWLNEGHDELLEMIQQLARAALEGGE